MQPRRELILPKLDVPPNVHALGYTFCLHLRRQVRRRIIMRSDQITGYHGGHLAWLTWDFSSAQTPRVTFVRIPDVLGLVPDSSATYDCSTPSQCHSASQPVSLDEAKVDVCVPPVLELLPRPSAVSGRTGDGHNRLSVERRCSALLAVRVLLLQLRRQSSPPPGVTSPHQRKPDASSRRITLCVTHTLFCRLSPPFEHGSQRFGSHRSFF